MIIKVYLFFLPSAEQPIASWEKFLYQLLNVINSKLEIPTSMTRMFTYFLGKFGDYGFVNYPKTKTTITETTQQQRQQLLQILSKPHSAININSSIYLNVYLSVHLLRIHSPSARSHIRSEKKKTTKNKKKE